MLKKMLFLLAILLFCNAEAAHAIRIKKTPDQKIVHESGGINTVQNFLEDVLFLLPTDLSTLLAKNFTQLSASARFTIPNNYWQHNVLEERELKQVYYGIAQDFAKVKSETLLAKNLGKTVGQIVEIGMVPNSFDPLKEQLRNNLTNFLTTAHSRTYLIDSGSYQNHSFDSEIKKLYSLRRYNKQDAYPELVKITANLWTAVWVATGHSDTIVPQSFTRRPFQLAANMRVVNNYNSYYAEMERRALAIRTYDDYVQLVNDWEKEMSMKELVKQRADDLRKAQGNREEVLIIDTDDLVAAIKQQRLAQENPFSITLDHTVAITEADRRDSLEIALLKLN